MRRLQDRESGTPRWSAQAKFTTPVPPAGLFRSLASTAAVLDVGCGNGRALAYLADRGFRDLIGIDLSGELVRQARTQVPIARLLVCRSEAIALATASIDLALCMAVLSYSVADVEARRVVAELYRVVRPGKSLYLTDFAEDPDLRCHYVANSNRLGCWGIVRTQYGIVRHRTLDHLLKLFHGWQPVDCRSEPLLTWSNRMQPGVVVTLRRGAS